jgi:hypothetical protein
MKKPARGTVTGFRSHPQGLAYARGLHPFDVGGYCLNENLVVERAEIHERGA